MAETRVNCAESRPGSSTEPSQNHTAKLRFSIGPNTVVRISSVSMRIESPCVGDTVVSPLWSGSVDIADPPFRRSNQEAAHRGGRDSAARSRGDRPQPLQPIPDRCGSTWQDTP